MAVGNKRQLGLVLSAALSVIALCAISSGIEPTLADTLGSFEWFDLTYAALATRMMIARLFSLWILTPIWLLLSILYQAGASTDMLD